MCFNLTVMIDCVIVFTDCMKPTVLKFDLSFLQTDGDDYATTSEQVSELI